MTPNQTHLRNSHLRHVEEVAPQLKALGFQLTRLAEWSGGQPHTEFRRPGAYVLIFGHARCELYVKGVKVDGIRINVGAYSRKPLDRLLAKAS